MQLDLYQMLLNNNEAAYREIYKSHFAFVKSFVLKNNGDEDELKDLFQESIIALWDNIHNGKYTHKNETMLHGYFRNICRFKWLEILRSKSKLVSISDNNDFDMEGDVGVLNELIKRDEINEFNDVFALISEKCRQILSLFYYDKKNMKEISEITGYEITSMRNEKYKCIEKLRQVYFRTLVK